MAEIIFSQDKVRCPLCLDLLKDPLTIPCGHSFCMSCFTHCWNQDDQKRVYSCPQCRQTFTPRPALFKNTMLTEVVKQLKKPKLQVSVPAGSEDVECDVCTVKRQKAVKSCLVCLKSYCPSHLLQHKNLFKGKRHNLIDATGRLKEKICLTHNKLLDIYCHTDQQCICYLCAVDNHKNHDTIAAVAESTKKQNILKETQKRFQQRIQQRKKDLEELREAVKSHKRSAETAVEDSEKIFTELIRSIERSRSKLRQMIRVQEKTAVSRAEGLMEKLMQEIDDLRRTHAELEQLSHTNDHIHFLKSFQSLPVFPQSTDTPSITVSSLLSLDYVGKSVTQLKEKLEDFCKEIDTISGRATYIENFPTNEPKTRKDFLQYYSKFTLDPNTVNEHLRLSIWNGVFNVPNAVQKYPDHPDRFDKYPQVLCREKVCGRRYWELEWSGDDGVDISVSYKTISRKGERDECVFGCNDLSWSLDCSPLIYSFLHNNSYTDLSVPSSHCRIGVYVDHSAGTLSFYSVSDTMSLIHTVQTTFTQPLYPGFAVHNGSRVKLCDLSI